MREKGEAMSYKTRKRSSPTVILCPLVRGNEVTEERKGREEEIEVGNEEV